jgi:hypothetical protein
MYIKPSSSVNTRSRRMRIMLIKRTTTIHHTLNKVPSQLSDGEGVVFALHELKVGLLQDLLDTLDASLGVEGEVADTESLAVGDAGDTQVEQILRVAVAAVGHLAILSMNWIIVNSQSLYCASSNLYATTEDVG